MSEIMPHPKDESLVEKSEAIVMPEATSPVENDREQAPSTSVASTVLHERGGRVADTLQKGDILINPETGERQVVEFVRGKGAKKEIFFTDELKEGVRAQPGEPIRRLPVRNFEVQRAVSGLTEKLPAFAQEFDAIDSACQEVFKAVNKEYQRQKQSGSVTQEAEALMDLLEPLSEKMGEIAGTWEVLWAENDSANESQLRTQLDSLKQLVADIPAELVKPFPILKQVQSAMKEQPDRVERDEEEQHRRGGRTKGGGLTKKRRQSHESGTDIGSELSSETTKKYSTRRERVVPEAIDPELLHGIVEDKFVKYGLSQKEWGEDWADDERHALTDWIAAIRVAQQDLTDLAKEIRHARRIGRWEQAMDSLNPKYRSFAQSDNGDAVAVRLAAIEGGLAQLTEGSAEWTAYATEHRPELQAILFHYLDILRAGVNVIAQARQYSSDQTQEKGNTQKTKSDHRRDEGQQRGRGQSRKQSGDMASSSSEMPNNEHAERSAGGVETENGDAELGHWIEGLHQQLNDLDRLTDRINKKGLTEGLAGALFAMSTEHEEFARAKKVKMVLGELADLESTLLTKRQWKSQEDYDEWLGKTLTRLQDYSRLYNDILGVSERILKAKPRRNHSATSVRNEQPRGSRHGEVIDMSPTELALQTVGPTWGRLEQGVQTKVLDGINRVADATRTVVDRANAALEAKGVAPDKRRAMITEIFAPKVSEAVGRIMAHVGFSPREITQLTRTLLIAQPHPVPRVAYDDKQ